MPPDLVISFTITHKLRNYATTYLSLRSPLRNCASTEVQEQTNILLFQCSVYM